MTIAKGYAERCRVRGMTVEVTQSEYMLTFTLRYGDGQKRSLVGATDHGIGNKLGVTGHWPDYDGKRYLTPPMSWYDKARWSEDRYEALLKKDDRGFHFLR